MAATVAGGTSQDMGEEGLSGSDVFDNYLVEINFPDHKFKLTELPKRPDAKEQANALNLDTEADPLRPLHRPGNAVI